MNDDEMTALRERLMSRGAPHPANVGFLRGWAEMLSTLDGELIAIDPGYTIVQVKEKFGGLRYYFDTSEDLDEDAKIKMRLLVDATEGRSYKICEECGEPGVLRKTANRWYFTACNAHSGGAEPVRKD